MKKEMIENLKKQNFARKIINAFEKIKREDFVPANLKSYVYEDIALPIGYSQTISQPCTIAFMLKLLELKEKQKILEIGSGSGYVLALINELSRSSEIFGVERIKELAERSRKILFNFKNIKIINKNGARGLKGKSPFDRILVSASSKKIPTSLIEQLKVNGILVSPVKNSIFKIRKSAEQNKITEFPGFEFVPIIED